MSVYANKLKIKGYVYTTELIVRSAAIQARPMSCNQTEARMLVVDWLKLTSLGWVAAELTVS